MKPTISTRVPGLTVGVILDAVRKFADDLEAGGVPPDGGELHEIAREALRAEYAPKRP